MAQQIINVGTADNDGTGDTLRVSQQKANANFTELYTAPGGGTQNIEQVLTEGNEAIGLQQIFTDTGNAQTVIDANAIQHKDLTTDASIIVNSNFIQRTTNNGDESVSLEFENPTGVSGTGVIRFPDVGDSQKDVAYESYVDAKKQRFFLTADISNDTVADANVTGFTFTLAPSSKCDFRVCLPFTSVATTTGINVGVKITTAVGADGNVIGNAYTKTRLSTTTISQAINVIDQVANSTVSYASLTGVSTTGLTNASEINVDLSNLSTNTSVTIQIVFASEVGGSAVVVKKGGSMVVDL